MFVRYVSHEIRTPLSAVVIGLNYMRGQFHDMDQDMIELVEEVRMSCEAAVDILNDLLNYENLDGGLLQIYFKLENAFDFFRYVTKPFKQQVRPLKRRKNKPVSALFFRRFHNHRVRLVSFMIETFPSEQHPSDRRFNLTILGIFRRLNHWVFYSKW